MFDIIGLAFDMVVVSVIFVPLVLLWVFYILKKKPSSQVIGLGTSMFVASYVILLVLLFCWQCKAEDDNELREYRLHQNPDTTQLNP
ncbi:MAG: hypothetical protein JWN14_4867 [Chthonomonadales bacterium]|nr:hypothetical protein [Chthonomonadales bacterium]